MQDIEKACTCQTCLQLQLNTRKKNCQSLLKGSEEGKIETIRKVVVKPFASNKGTISC